MDSICILLIQRYRILVEALTESFRHSDDLFLDYTLGDPRSAPTVLAKSAVDVVLFDVRTTESATGHIRRMKAARPSCNIVLFGLSEPARIVNLLEAGACGFVALDAPFDELEKAVRHAHAGRASTTPEVVTEVLTRLRRLCREVDVPTPGPPLTPKERQVLRLLADDATNRQIARRLGVSLSTVKMHVHNLLAKLGVKSRRDAVRVAARSGLLPSLPVPGRPRRARKVDLEAGKKRAPETGA